MNEKLNEYLNQVKAYLNTSDNKEDIIKELEAVVLEKAEKKYGQITDESISKILSEFGSPAEVAKEYSDEQELIDPSYKNYIFMLTNTFFALIIGINLITNVFRISFTSFKPENLFLSILEIIGTCFSTYFMLFGIICFLFFMLTKYKIKNIAAFWEYKDLSTFLAVKPPKVGEMISKIIFFSVFTLFVFFGIDAITVLLSKSGLQVINISDKSIFFAFLFVGLFDILVYAVKFYRNTELLDIVKGFFDLILLWFATIKMESFRIADIAEEISKGISIGLKVAFIVITVLVIIELIVSILRYSINKTKNIMKV